MTFTCEKHGDYEGEMVPTLSAILTHGSEVQPSPCPVCVEEHEKAIAEKEKESRESMLSADIAAANKRQNIEPDYWGATLEGYHAKTAEQKKALSTIERMIASKRGKVVMLGKNGTGKTHLAVCAVRALDGRILSMYEITTRIRATYSARSKEDELDVVDELSRLSLLAIDEIGRTKGSDAETNWLSYIIDKRHARRLPLILISNKHQRRECPKKDGCQDCLENYLSEDIMSRLREDGVVVRFDWDDYRKVKRTEAIKGEKN